MKKYISFLLASSLTLAPVLVMADVQIGSTRVIYNSSANEAALPIKIPMQRIYILFSPGWNQMQVANHRLLSSLHCFA